MKLQLVSPDSKDTSNASRGYITVRIWPEGQMASKARKETLANASAAGKSLESGKFAASESMQNIVTKLSVLAGLGDEIAKASQSISRKKEILTLATLRCTRIYYSFGRPPHRSTRWVRLLRSMRRLSVISARLSKTNSTGTERWWISWHRWKACTRLSTRFSQSLKR